MTGRPKEYIDRGTLLKCTEALFDVWAIRPDDILGIVFNPRGKYYAAVDQNFLADPPTAPGIEGSRLVFLGTFKELTSLVNWGKGTQSDMFS